MLVVCGLPPEFEGEPDPVVLGGTAPVSGLPVTGTPCEDTGVEMSEVSPCWPPPPDVLVLVLVPVVPCGTSLCRSPPPTFTSSKCVPVSMSVSVSGRSVSTSVEGGGAVFVEVR